MNAVGLDPLGEADVVIDNESYIPGRADFLQRPGEARGLVLLDALYAELERGDRARAERAFEPLGESAGNIERRNQVKLAVCHRSDW